MNAILELVVPAWLRHFACRSLAVPVCGQGRASQGGRLSNVTRRIATTSNISNKVNLIFQGRLQTAQERFKDRISKAYDENVASLMTRAWTQSDDLGGRLTCLTISAR